MLHKRPTEADRVATANWDSTNLTVEIFNIFWKKISPDLAMPGTMAGDVASCVEWKGKNNWGDDCKYFGTRKADGAKHGVIRSVSEYCINEATYFEDKKHGLSFVWWTDNTLSGYIYEHGKEKAFINWNKNWSEKNSKGNKELLNDLIKNIKK